jgi:hypothetical protein
MQHSVPEEITSIRTIERERERERERDDYRWYCNLLTVMRVQKNNRWKRQATKKIALYRGSSNTLQMEYS